MFETLKHATQISISELDRDMIKDYVRGGKASNDFDFEVDDNGDDDWFACIYLTLVYDVYWLLWFKIITIYGC